MPSGSTAAWSTASSTSRRSRRSRISNRREIITLAPLVLLIIYYGVQPGPILDAFAAPTEALMKSVQAALATVKTAARRTLRSR